MHPEAKKLIDTLELQPHPEGGFYKEVHRSRDEVLSLNTNDKRNACTSIFYLLTSNDYSAWHRLKSDEIWHFYQGSPLNIYVLNKNEIEIRKLGNPLQTVNASFKVIVEANQWFAAQPENLDSYTLAGCTVAPGFDFMDFEMADSKLIAAYPVHEKILRKFLRVPLEIQQ